jgi:BirA family biotin operon repressor/biotin-[acetyl-CoA-carboxylase] ligase
MLRPGSGSREALLEALSDAFAHWRNVWGRGAQFAAIRDAWLGQCRTLGRPIRVNTQGALLAGTFKTIDSEGRLVIVADDGATLALEAGDVLI